MSLDRMVRGGDLVGWCGVAGKTLGRESALHMLACIARGGGGDSVAMIGGPGLQVNPVPRVHDSMSYAATRIENTAHNGEIMRARQY